MKRTIFAIIAFAVSVFALAPAVQAQTESNRKERQAITEGNKLYNEGRYRAAMLKYRQALDFNPSSAAAQYNLGLSQIRLGTNPSDTTQAAKDMLQKGTQAMEQVARMTTQKPQLASRANYNLGNVAFDSEDYKKALDFYKQSLRLNPEDAAAKRNLRITQLKLQNQDDNQDDNQNQDQNQDQDQDQNQDQNRNQDQQQDQNQDQQPPKQDQKDKQDLNQQTADQILQAMENKENQTRSRQGTNQAQQAKGRNRNTKNW